MTAWSVPVVTRPARQLGWIEARRMLRQRTLAAVLGLLRGPVAAAVAATALLLLLEPGTTSAAGNPVHERPVPDYLQVPALVLGAGLLGIAVSRWFPRPGALPLTVLVICIGTITLYQPVAGDTVHGSTWFALWPVWLATTEGELPPQPLHQEIWHLAYLLGLGTLAGLAALLRTPGPRRALWIGAAATAALAAVASWQQLG